MAYAGQTQFGKCYSVMESISSQIKELDTDKLPSSLGTTRTLRGVTKEEWGRRGKGYRSRDWVIKKVYNTTNYILSS